MPIRVLIVDDSAFMRKVLGRMIEGADGLELVGTARDGQDAVEAIDRLRPDVVTMDIEMPRVSGMEALKRIREKDKRSPAVLMCSSLTVQGSHAALDALRLGAADIIAKDPSVVGRGDAAFGEEFVSKVRAIAPRSLRSTAPRSRGSGPAFDAVHKSLTAAAEKASKLPKPTSLRETDRFEVLVIGSSTGGPPVLERVISGLPEGFGLPVLVAQHMPELFTRSLAQRLDQSSRVHVRIAEDGLPLEPGTVTIGLGGQHIVVAGRPGAARVGLTGEPASALYKPDVDELFASASTLFGRAVLGVVFTGMGDDGSTGAVQIRRAGGAVVAQDEASCVVWGMPRAVVEKEAAEAVGSPDEILAFVRGLRGRAQGAPPVRDRPPMRRSA